MAFIVDSRSSSSMIAKALRDEGQNVQNILYITNAKLDPRLARHGVGDSKVVQTAPDECGHILTSRQDKTGVRDAVHETTRTGNVRGV